MKNINNNLALTINSNKGFTLLELMIVVALIGIISSLAVPSYQKSKTKAALQRTALELESSLTLARISAMTQGEFVSVCPVANVGNIAISTTCLNDWDSFVALSPNQNLGWMVFADNNRDSTINNLSDLIEVTRFDSNNQISINSGQGIFRFTRKGSSSSPANSINVLMKDSQMTAGSTNEFTNSRRVIVSPEGRVRMEKKGY